MKYYKICRVRCLCCGDILEHIHRTKTENCVHMLWCSCGKVGLDPAAAGYRILGDSADYEDLSEEWAEESRYHDVTYPKNRFGGE